MSLVQVTKSTAGAVDLLYRDTNLPGSSQTFTVVFNHLANAGSASFGAMGLRANTAENVGAFLGCYITSAGIFRLNSATGAAYAGYGENAILTDTTNSVWVAIVSDGTNIRSYYKIPGGALTAGPTRTALSFTPVRMMCGQGSNSAIGKRGAFGFYSRALSVGEISRIFSQRGPAIHDGLLFWNSCLGSTMHVDESGTGGNLTQGTDLAQSSVAGEPKLPWRLRSVTSTDPAPSSLSGTASYSAWSATGALTTDTALAGTASYSAWGATGALDGNPAVAGTAGYSAWGASGLLESSIVLDGVAIYSAWGASGNDGLPPLDGGAIIIPFRGRLRFVRR